MFGRRTRREFLSQAGTLAAAGAIAAACRNNAPEPPPRKARTIL